MDNRINEIRRRIIILRNGMACVQDILRDRIRRDQDSTKSALQLIAMRIELATLVAEWRAAGGSVSLPTIEERLKAGSRPAQKTKAVALN